MNCTKMQCYQLFEKNASDILRNILKLESIYKSNCVITRPEFPFWKLMKLGRDTVNGLDILQSPYNMNH